MNHKYQSRKAIKEKLEIGDLDGIITIFRDNCCKIDLRGLEIHDLVISDLDFFDMFNNGSIWTRISLSNIIFNTSDFRGVIFRDTIFENLTFKNSSFVGAKFTNSQFKNVEFIACDLSGAKFNELLSTDIEFHSCNLYNTGLIGEKCLDKIKSVNIMDYTYTIVSKLLNHDISILPKTPYLFARMLLNSDIPLHSIKIGKNCRFAHLGFGTIIAGGCQIGENVWIGPKVNIFGRNGNIPIIGNNVIIGIGSTIAANIGDNSIIGAGSLVFDDVPNNCIITGEKAKIKL
jgi:serine O-acetyltransferase